MILISIIYLFITHEKIAHKKLRINLKIFHEKGKKKLLVKKV